jgi:hypothetical protein
MTPAFGQTSHTKKQTIEPVIASYLEQIVGPSNPKMAQLFMNILRKAFTLF